MEPNPYAQIAEFWGEDLNHELASRICGAPDDHLEAFNDSRAAPGLSELPELAPGRLRPILHATVEESTLPPPSSLRAAEIAPSILLYAHEIVVPDVSFALTFPYEEVRRRAVDWLLAMRPLYDQGVVHFRSLQYTRVWGWTPSDVSVPTPESTTEEVIPDIDDDLPGHIEAVYRLCGITGPARAQVDELARRIRLRNHEVSADDSEVRRVADFLASEPYLAHCEVIGELGMDVGVHMTHDGWNNRAHRLFRSAAEYQMFRTAFPRAASTDARDANLIDLANLAVPSLIDHVPTLVAVRSQSEVFEEWRSRLANALDRMTLSEPHDAFSVQRARQRLQEELLPASQAIAVETRKSAALSALRSGMNSFSFALVSGLAGYGVGGDLASAAASAATGKGIEAVQSYRNRRKEQRRQSAIQEMVLTLTKV